MNEKKKKKRESMIIHISMRFDYIVSVYLMHCVYVKYLVNLHDCAIFSLCLSFATFNWIHSIPMRERIENR